jgi:cytochrome c
MKRCKNPDEVEVVSEAAAYVPDDEDNTGEIASAGGAAAATSGSEIYDRHCALCHAEGIGGAPVVGDADGWAGRIEQGMKILYQHAIQGYTGEDGIMPPKGGFVNLSDAEVRLAVDYIVGHSQ